MVYVFHVEKGATYILQMNIIVENVSTLKAALLALTSIDVKSQVLLVSGGEVLVNERKVGSYHAGTDTNPMFLFNANLGGESIATGMLSSSGGSTSSAQPATDAGANNNVEDSGSTVAAATRVSEFFQSVDAVLSMPASSNAIAARIQLAQDFKDMALKEENLCRRVVQQQHMQHQGWAAVIANLEDCTVSFMKAKEVFDQAYRRFVAEKERRWIFLQTFIDEDMVLLRKIPIFLCFAPWRNVGGDDAPPTGTINFHPARGASEDDSKSPFDIAAEHDSTSLSEHASAKIDNPPSFYSMLDWIDQASYSPVENLVDNCMSALNAVDESDVLEELLDETNDIAERATASEMKQIKGLSDRLYGLEQLQQELSKLAKTLIDVVHTFLHSIAIPANVASTSASNMLSTLDFQARDVSFMPSMSSPTRLGVAGGRSGSPSSSSSAAAAAAAAAAGMPGGSALILPAEDARQIEQLQKLQLSMKRICDIRARCLSAKDELCLNLTTRLRWVIYVERNMAEINAKLSMHIENFKRLRRTFTLLEQIHDAPRLYVLACFEIARRKQFSRSYEQWAKNIAERSRATWLRENMHRHRVAENFGAHFLRSVMNGLFYGAPQFAQNVPHDLERQLPQLLGEAELAQLRLHVPELCAQVELELNDDAPDEHHHHAFDAVNVLPSMLPPLSDADTGEPASSSDDTKVGAFAATNIGADGAATSLPAEDELDRSVIFRHHQNAATSGEEQFEVWHSTGNGTVMTMTTRPDSATEDLFYAMPPPSVTDSHNQQTTTAAPVISTIANVMLSRSSDGGAAAAIAGVTTTKPSNVSNNGDTERLVRSAMALTGDDEPLPIASALVGVDKLVLLATDISISSAKLITTCESSAQTSLTGASLDLLHKRHFEIVAACENIRTSSTVQNQHSLREELLRFGAQLRDAAAELRTVYETHVAGEAVKIKILHDADMQIERDRIVNAEDEVQILRQQLNNAAAAAAAEQEQQQQLLSAADDNISTMRTSPGGGSVMESSVASLAMPQPPLPLSLSSSPRTSSLPRSASTYQQQTATVAGIAAAAAMRSTTAVSIFTCQPNDLVFVTFNVDIARFVVFQLGRSVPFVVDPKSYAELGLPGTSDNVMVPLSSAENIDNTTKTLLALARTPPVVAQVVRKDYCVATKAPNRYRMPMDSKFYRVKVKKFESNAAHALLLRQQSSSTAILAQQHQQQALPTPLSSSNISQSIYLVSTSPSGSGGADPSWVRSL